MTRPMTRSIQGAGGVVAGVCAAIFTCSAVVVLSATLVGDRLVAMQTAQAGAISDGRLGPTINREGKGDALIVPSAVQTRSEIKTVEVIGVRNASIVYRDRKGNILFQTDPLANVTVVTKNVDLPEVTIRETEASEVERMPAENIQRSEPPQGCESAFARPSPEALTRTPSRCVT